MARAQHWLSRRASSNALIQGKLSGQRGQLPARSLAGSPERPLFRMPLLLTIVGYGEVSDGRSISSPEVARRFLL